MNRKVQAVEAIIFDFGGVFTRIDVSEALFRSWDLLLGLSPGSMRAALHSGPAWEAVSTGRITPDDYWAQVGAPLESRLPLEFRKLRTGVFLVEPIDEDMVRLANDLRRSTRLALCSNAVYDLSIVLEERPDVRALFEEVVVSVEVGLRKPDPAILALTAQRLGIAPGGCLLVDDKERNTNAARAIGMQSIQFCSTDQLAVELRDRGILTKVAPEDAT